LEVSFQSYLARKVLSHKTATLHIFYEWCDYNLQYIYNPRVSRESNHDLLLAESQTFIVHNGFEKQLKVYLVLLLSHILTLNQNGYGSL
jgi:hypothetical protein